MTKKQKQTAVKLEKEGKSFHQKAMKNIERIGKLEKETIKLFKSATDKFNKATKLYK